MVARIARSHSFAITRKKGESLGGSSTVKVYGEDSAKEIADSSEIREIVHDNQTK